MDKIYFVRHQAHGIVAEFPFKEHPTEQQVDAVWRWCFNIHGASHKKTPNEKYWTKVVEFNVLGAEIPDVPRRELGPAGKPGEAESSAELFTTAGTGRVTEGDK